MQFYHINYCIFDMEFITSAMYKKVFLLGWVLWACVCATQSLRAQIFEDPQYEGYYFIVENGDTFDLYVFPEVIITPKGPLTEEQANYWRRLRYNVYKVYNYSIIASRIINEIDNDLQNISNKKERKKYLRAKEEFYSKKYKKELKNLSKSQGIILVKLINRNTGKDAYSLIKELRGGLTARASQTAAYFFDNDLKAVYDPHGVDRDIEMIVQEIEAPVR